MLYLTQPRPDDCALPYGHEMLRPIVARWELGSVAVAAVSIPRERFESFMEAIGFEGGNTGQEADISFTAFMKICEVQVSDLFLR